MATPLAMEDAIKDSKPNLLKTLLQQHAEERGQPTSNALFLQLFKVALNVGTRNCLDVLLHQCAEQHLKYSEIDETNQEKVSTSSPPLELKLLLLNVLTTRSGETVAHIACQLNSPLVLDILEFLGITSVFFSEANNNASEKLALVNLVDSHGHTLLHTCLSAGADVSLNALKEHFSSSLQSFERLVSLCEEGGLGFPRSSCQQKVYCPNQNYPPNSPMELAASVISLQKAKEENFRKALQLYLQLFLNHCSRIAKSNNNNTIEPDEKPIEKKILYNWLARLAENIGNRDGLVLHVMLSVLHSLVPLCLHNVLSGAFVPPPAALAGQLDTIESKVIVSKQTILHIATAKGNAHMVRAIFAFLAGNLPVFSENDVHVAHLGTFSLFRELPSDCLALSDNVEIFHQFLNHFPTLPNDVLPDCFARSSHMSLKQHEHVPFWNAPKDLVSALFYSAEVREPLAPRHDCLIFLLNLVFRGANRILIAIGDELRRSKKNFMPFTLLVLLRQCLALQKLDTFRILLTWPWFDCGWKSCHRFWKNGDEEEINGLTSTQQDIINYFLYIAQACHDKDLLDRTYSVTPPPHLIRHLYLTNDSIVSFLDCRFCHEALNAMAEHWIPLLGACRLPRLVRNYVMSSCDESLYNLHVLSKVLNQYEIVDDKVLPSDLLMTVLSYQIDLKSRGSCGFSRRCCYCSLVSELHRCQCPNHTVCGGCQFVMHPRCCPQPPQTKKKRERESSNSELVLLCMHCQEFCSLAIEERVAAPPAPQPQALTPVAPAGPTLVYGPGMVQQPSPQPQPPFNQYPYNPYAAGCNPYAAQPGVALTVQAAPSK